MAEKDRYDPVTEEPKIETLWEKEKVYAFNPNSTAEIYSIDTPPPTVSGKMHIGHAFSYSQQDFIARFQRMMGKNVFFPFGTDDNGLATERLIEKTKKVSSKKMERDAFIKLCLETLEEIRPQFINDWKRIGFSADFNMFYSTINDHCRKISQKSFLDLYKAGRVYQKKAPIIFCPICKTAIAQVEMEDVEKKSTLNYIKAETETGEFIIYATTRPELHPGCVGISLNKEGDYVTIKRDNGEKWIIAKDAVEKMKDEFPMEIIETYKGSQLIGKKVKIPMAKNPVPLTHDLSAKTEYGSGIVFYCTYGGLDCVEWMARHTDVEPVHIMDESGTYNESSPYKGMRSAEARKQALEDLEKSGNLIKKEHMKHAVNTHERCGNDIEYVATKQWFIKYLDLREHFLESGKQLKWYPPHMKVRFDNWIKGLKWDWCISRQRHFGVPIPIWYDKDGKVILAEEDQLPVDPLKDKPKGHKEFTPEEDVLDTWATSSMTPSLAIELFDDKKLKDKLFPMNLRPQAHDIITFWLFNTLVKSQLHHQKNPWENVMISGFALDPHGRKMSKSKGNVVAPQDVIEKYGADALRFWAAGSKLGEDLPYQEKDLLTGKKMINKLWNASKFVFMHLENYKRPKSEPELEFMDTWLLSKLNRLTLEATDTFKEYEYAKVKKNTEYFFWHNLCDNYLEIVKDRLYNEEKRGKKQKEAAQYTLHTTLLTVLKLLAPIMPYITETLYQKYYTDVEKKKSIHITQWPGYDMKAINEETEKVGDQIIQIIAAVRKAKSAKNLSLGTEIKSVTIECSEELGEKLKPAFEDLKGALKAENIAFGKATEEVNENIRISVEF